MVKNKKITGIIAGTLAVIILVGSSFALFTARGMTKSGNTTARFNIEIENTVNPEGNMVPGDIRTLKYDVKSYGNVSTDVRETIIVNVPNGREDFVADGTTGQSQFDIYLASDVSQDATGAYVPNADAQPLQTKTIVDGKTIKYQPAEYTLNENEVQAHDYVVLFKKDASNMWKQQMVNFSVMVEAKQNANNAADWSEVETIEYTMASGQTLNVVVDEDDAFIRLMADGKLVASNFEDSSLTSAMMTAGQTATYTATQFGEDVEVALAVSGDGAQYITITDNVVSVASDAVASGDETEYLNTTLTITINGVEQTRELVVMVFPE